MPDRQPWLHQLVTVVSAPGLALSGPDGQLTGAGAAGVYLGDHRVLSRLEVTVDGAGPVPLRGWSTGVATARFVGVARELGDPGPDPTVFVERDRTVSPTGVRETIVLVSRAREPVTCVLAVAVGVDLADIADVKAGAAPPGPLPTVDAPDPGTARWHSPLGTVHATIHPPTPLPDPTGAAGTGTAGTGLTGTADAAGAAGAGTDPTGTADAAGAAGTETAGTDPTRPTDAAGAAGTGTAGTGPTGTADATGAAGTGDVSPRTVVTADGVRWSWDVVLPARGRWSVTVEVTAAVGAGPVVAAAPTRVLWEPPVLTAGDSRLPALVDRSVADLGGLLAADAAAPGDHFLTAGAPWYLTLFGRDSIWAARMALPLGTDLAAGTLRTLARRQGTRTDPATAEEPGKILHEVRSGGSGPTGGHLYYGTVDATPLWVSLLHDAWRWGLPRAEVEALAPHLEAALGWLRDRALDSDGFVRYEDRTGRGLANQGWKDSHDSVQFADGRLAAPPIALCEVQAYAYAAARQGADLLDALGRPGGDGWRDWADELADRFRARFWVADPVGAYPAIALDGTGRPVDAVTSNLGHLLGTGLLSADETAAVVRRLAAPDMDSGVGLRTMSARSAGFNPLSYHGGSVWAHDTAIALGGLATVGTPAARGAAASLVRGLLTAGAAFDSRLPELHGGAGGGDRLPDFDGGAAGPPLPELHGGAGDPLPYPAACRPQAWSAAAALVVVTAVLGLRPDVPAGRLTLRPLRPSPVGELTVRGLRVAGAPLALHLTAAGELDVHDAPPGLTLDLP